jgi:hypothetical protein
VVFPRTVVVREPHSGRDASIFSFPFVLPPNRLKSVPRPGKCVV